MCRKLLEICGTFSALKAGGTPVYPLPMAPAADSHATHTVFNQSPPLEGYNPFASDRALVEALRREGAGWAEERVRAFGEIVGRAETIG